MFFSKKELPTIKGYTSNSELQTIMPNYAGTPLDQNGKDKDKNFSEEQINPSKKVNKKNL